MIDPDPDPRIFGWLGKDASGCPYHLHPLNLVWSSSGYLSDLQRFYTVAERLKQDPDYWSDVLRAVNWRFVLVGCVCVLLTNEKSRFSDLTFRFEHGSWVSPQIAVTLGLTSPEATIPYFNALLDHQSPKLSTKAITSAHAVLNKLGHLRNDFPREELLTDLDRDDASVANHVVEQHWDFWGAYRQELQE